MRRRPTNDQEPVGNDSFLDVVANIVGILIILVMVVGMRVKHAAPLSVQAAPSPAATPADDAQRIEALQAARRELAAYEQEAIRQIQRDRELAREIHSRRIQRERLSTSVTAIDYQLKEKQSKLSETQRAEMELKNELARTQAALDALEQQRALAAGMEPTPDKIETIATPISRTVFGKEEHFRVTDGRIAYIPLEQLIEATKSAAQSQVWKLNGVPEVSDTVAPLEGFALRYTIGRIPAIDGRVGTLIGFTRWEIVPIGEGQGETLSEALAPGSRFRRVLAASPRGKTTITLWTYPDSFEMYRALKTELFKLGYAAAGRPLPAGVAIAGSPGGSKTATQ
jgi:hypothetical protein